MTPHGILNREMDTFLFPDNGVEHYDDSWKHCVMVSLPRAVNPSKYDCNMTLSLLCVPCYLLASLCSPVTNRPQEHK